MIDVKLTTPAPAWPWARQTPGGSGQWGPFRFQIDQSVERCDAWIVYEGNDQEHTCLCPPERTIFISGEPDSVGHYPAAYLAQFGLVVSSRLDLQHPNIVRMQQGQPWFVEQSYDDLLVMAPPFKTRDICLITSDKTFTSGHQQRLEFVEQLKQHLGDRLDIFGRGIRDFDRKWDILAPYRFTIVLENYCGDDFITEKMPDAWLAYCYPFYAGCTNLGRYIQEGSYEELDMSDVPGSVKKLLQVVNDSTKEAVRREHLVHARRYYLEQMQCFSLMGQLLQQQLGQPASAPCAVTIRPRSAFTEVPQRASLAQICRSTLRRQLVKLFKNKEPR
jgi:hypothetical protein